MHEGMREMVVEGGGATVEDKDGEKEREVDIFVKCLFKYFFSR